MFDKLRYSAFVIEFVRALHLLALVFDGDSNPFVEKGLLAKPLRQLIKAELGGLKDTTVRLEGDLGPTLPRFSRLFQFGDRYAALVLLLVGQAVSPDLELQRL